MLQFIPPANSDGLSSPWHVSNVSMDYRLLFFHEDGHTQEVGNHNTFVMNARGDLVCHGDHNTIGMNGQGGVTVEGDRNSIRMNSTGYMSITGHRNTVTVYGQGDVFVVGDENEVTVQAYGSGSVFINGDRNVVNVLGFAAMLSMRGNGNQYKAIGTIHNVEGNGIAINYREEFEDLERNTDDERERESSQDSDIENTEDNDDADSGSDDDSESQDDYYNESEDEDASANQLPARLNNHYVEEHKDEENSSQSIDYSWREEIVGETDKEVSCAVDCVICLSKVERQSELTTLPCFHQYVTLYSLYF